MNRELVFVIDSHANHSEVKSLELLAGELQRRKWGVAVWHVEHAVNVATDRFDNLDLEVVRHRVSKYDLRTWWRLKKQISAIDRGVVSLWCLGRNALAAARNLKIACIETQFSEYKCDQLGRWGNYLPNPNLFVGDSRVLAQHRFGSDLRNQQTLVVPGVPRLVGATEGERVEVRKSLGIPVESKLVVTAGPLVPHSDLKDLVWACDLIKCIRDDVHLVICGRGQQRDALHNFVRCTECKSNVHFECDSDATRMIRAADVYWSSDRDVAHPHGVLESMALRIPVVSVLTSTNADLIRHQQTAMAVDPGRRDQYARWTKFLLEQHTQRDQLVDQAGIFVDANFSLSRMADEYEELLGRLLR